MVDSIAVEAEPPRLLAEHRGALRVNDRAIKAVVGGAIHEGSIQVFEYSVDVNSMSDGISLVLSMTISYPNEPIGPLLDNVRQQLGRVMVHQLGRPVKRIDIRIEGFRNARSVLPVSRRVE